jgi:predicted AlkP superfamily pyrophosphatase or phosphodiesterase
MSSGSVRQATRGPAEHVVLVSVDALRPEFYQNERWPMPTVQQLASVGAYARAVRSVFPALTYPAHTTIVTGALPVHHGVCHNRPFEPGGQSGRWLWESAHIRAPTLWDAVRAAGGTTAAVSWPVTVGAPIDWNVPDVWPLDASVDAMAPVRTTTTPAGLFEELERNATGPLTGDTFAISRLVREDRVGAIGAYLFERYRPTLLLLHCIGTDHVQHELGRDNPRVRRACGAADRAISQVLETVERLGLDDRTAFVVTGDHGSSDVHSQLRPNVWLADAGLMAPREDRGDWRATFLASGGSAFLFLRDPADGDALWRVREVLAAQPPGVRALFTVVERDTLDALGADPDTPLALCAAPGVELHESPVAPDLVAKLGAAHGYLPDVPEMQTGFVAAGAGVRAGAVVPLMALQDIAPIVAALLGIPFAAPDGVLLPGILAPSRTSAAAPG